MSTDVPAADDRTTHLRVRAKVEGLASVVFLEHAAVRTSEEAAQVRGGLLGNGAKALLVKAKTKGDQCDFVLVVMAADRKLDSKKLRKLLGVKSLAFATEDEVAAVTGALPGAVPPFGSVFGLRTHMDSSLSRCQTIEFNAGLRTHSIRVSLEDYLACEAPILCDVIEQ